MKRGLPAVTVCSTAFEGLGHAQARSLSCPDLPIALVPHPFGARSRDEIRNIAAACVGDIARLIAGSGIGSQTAHGSVSRKRAQIIEMPSDLDAFNEQAFARKWSDGLPLIPPTPARVARMLEAAGRDPAEIVARVPPAFGAASVEGIAINAAMAGARPEYMSLLITAVQAVSLPRFNLQSVQATTNPAAVWLIVNGPIANKLGVNAAGNCLGPGTWANATLGRALRLILQNIGGALPGDMDRATQGQPGKYSFCCAENEGASPWEPLHVERGFALDDSTITVAAPLGTWNMNTHAKNADVLLRVMAETMVFPASSDYTYAGEPWVMLAPEHAQILNAAGYNKAAVKQRLWELAILDARKLSPEDFRRAQNGRRAELGTLAPDQQLKISAEPGNINILVAGGPGTHSVYFPASAHAHATTLKIET